MTTLKKVCVFGAIGVVVAFLYAVTGAILSLLYIHATGADYTSFAITAVLSPIFAATLIVAYIFGGPYSKPGSNGFVASPSQWWRENWLFLSISSLVLLPIIVNAAASIPGVLQHIPYTENLFQQRYMPMMAIPWIILHFAFRRQIS